MLVDERHITLKAGEGGHGSVSFGKMAKSGPDGGNGGDGGDIIIEISSDLTLLGQFHHDQVVEAEDGVKGARTRKDGKRGNNLTIRLPFGTLLTDKDTKETFELLKINEKILICKGGIGGIGNYDQRSSINTTPLTAIPPGEAQLRRLHLSLRFIADYGLIGLPSAGKSSLLNELTNTNVKTAAYHFTTLSANLGVLPNKTIVADIPGLISGASDGKGLGYKFLKHIQKVTMLLHCISADSDNPIEDYEIIRKELESFDSKMLGKKEVIILTKTDLVDESVVKQNKKELEELGLKIITTSIHDWDSIQGLLKILT